MTTRDQLRRELRLQRARLTPGDRRAAALAAANRVSTTSAFRRAERVAGYIPVGGELDPGPLLERAFAADKEVYLPRLIDPPDIAMEFLRYTPETRMVANRYGIPEPPDDPDLRIPPQALDLVLVPLVAFDTHGNRLGMGAGYYDRTFAFLRETTTEQPCLLGLGYEFQHVAAID
ncbi:MAG: 5-formyltetrahydrofolate cyclo-ligase, partial [Gammaproteobacteria bacterium]